MKFIKQGIKKLDALDWMLVKLGVFTFAFALVTTFSELLTFVQSIDFKIWWAIAILAMIRPSVKCLKR